ncbi:MAG: hypothetical protein PHH06_00480 [Candidatus Gracilibacteria bacterium]|nr:hypothetical protein [Candidatus Gracilibacteria bacterium]
MVTSIETGVTKGSFNLSAIVSGTGTTTNKYTGTDTITYATGTTTATVALTSASTYEVGGLDFTVLGQNGDDFKDYDGNAYIAAVAAHGATSYYQLVGQTVTNAGDYKVVAKGNYVAKTTGDVNGLVSDADDLANTVKNDDVITGNNGIY